MEKLFKEPHWKILIAIAFVLFILSTACSAYTMLTFGDILAREGEITKPEKKLALARVYVSIWSFIVGLVSLVTFFLRNF